jgi:hypothetical protein
MTQHRSGGARAVEELNTLFRQFAIPAMKAPLR